MNEFDLIIGAVIVVLPFAIKVLEFVHMMEWLKKRWPKLHTVLLSRQFIVAILLAGVLLIVEHFYRDSRQDSKNGQNCAGQTGSAIVNGNGNAVNTGNCSQVNAGVKSSPDQGR